MLVTGAGAGLGRCYALTFAERGAMVVVNDLGVNVDGSSGDPSVADAVVRQIVSAGGTAIANTSSVADPDGAASMVSDAVAAFGRLDAVVCNAGILRDQAFHNIDRATLSEVVGVHLLGVFHVAGAAVREMRTRRHGRIVLTTSASGLYGHHGQTAYGAAKAAMIGLARSLAIEGASRDIRVNVVAPLGASRMSGSLLDGRTEEFAPERVAAVVAYLAHRSTEISGCCFSAGAGRVAEVVIAETDGYRDPALSPEAVRDHLDEIRRRPAVLEPNDLTHVTAIAAGR